MNKAINFIKKPVGHLLNKTQQKSRYRKAARYVSGFLPINIVTATEKDLKKLGILSGNNGHSRKQPLNCSIWDYVAKLHQIPIGFVQLVNRPEDSAPYSGFWIHGLIVKRPLRGFGVGEKLTRQAIQTAISENTKQIHLRVGEGNKAAQHLYQKLGFRINQIPGIDDLQRSQNVYRQVSMVRKVRV